MSTKLCSFFFFRCEHFVCASLVKRREESACQCRTRGFDPWVRKIPWRRKWQPTSVFLNKLFFHKPSCRVLGVGSLGSDSILKVVRSTELFQKMQGSVERAWAALPLPGWQAGMIILWCTYGHEIYVMFVHFSNDSGHVLWFSHLALKLAFCSTDSISPACNAKLNAQHFIQAHTKKVLFL